MNSLSQIYIMAVFGVKYRLGLIGPRWREKLYAVMSATLSDMDGVYPIKIGGVADHVHVLFRTDGKIGETEIIRKLKSQSSLWVNEQRLSQGRFAWQRGSSRFSYSVSAIETVKRYIANQEEHHRRLSFREELQKLYESMNLSYSDYDLPGELEDTQA